MESGHPNESNARAWFGSDRLSGFDNPVLAGQRRDPVAGLPKGFDFAFGNGRVILSDVYGHLEKAGVAGRDCGGDGL